MSAGPWRHSWPSPGVIPWPPSRFSVLLAPLEFVYPPGDPSGRNVGLDSCLEFQDFGFYPDFLEGFGALVALVFPLPIWEEFRNFGFDPDFLRVLAALLL